MVVFTGRGKSFLSTISRNFYFQVFCLLAKFGWSLKAQQRKGAASEALALIGTSGAKRKYGIKGRFALTVLLIVSGSFVVDGLIAPFKTTTKKRNVYGNHHKINGRYRVCVVDGAALGGGISGLCNHAMCFVQTLSALNLSFFPPPRPLFSLGVPDLWCRGTAEAGRKR